MPRTPLTRSDVQAMIDASMSPVQDFIMSYKANPTQNTRIQTRNFTSAQSPLAAPTSGIDSEEIIFTISAATTQAMYTANRTTCATTIKNAATSTAALTLTPKSGETFDNGNVTSLVLQPGDAYTLTNAANGTDYEVS